MFSFNSILLFLLLSCNHQQSLTLKCNIEGKVAIKDSSEVLINKSPQATLVVDSITESGLQVRIVFKKYMSIPKDSKIHIIEGMVGPNIFEIRLGSSKELMKNNDMITVL